MWNQSLPSYCVLPNLHHCPAHPQAFQIIVFFEPHLHCSHPGLFLVISSLLYCYFSLPTKTLVQLLTTPLLIYCNVFCLASIFHFLPQIIFVPLSWFGETPSNHTHTHTLLAHTWGCPCFLHPIQKFCFYLLRPCKYIFIGISSYFFILHPSATSTSPVLFFHPCPSRKIEKTAEAKERPE